MVNFKLRGIGLPALVFMVLLGLDQTSKRMAETHLLQWEKPETPSFYTAAKKEILRMGDTEQFFYVGVSYVRNFAAAFDGKDSLDGETSREVYSVIAGVALVLGLGIYLFYRNDFNLLQNLSCVAIFSGMAGNLYDRLRLGYVVDIIDIRWRYAQAASMLPHANLADVFMLIGFIVIVVSLLLNDISKDKSEKEL